MLKTPQQTHLRWWVFTNLVYNSPPSTQCNGSLSRSQGSNPKSTQNCWKPFHTPIPHTYITFLSMYRPPKWVIPTASLDISETSKIYCFCWKSNRYCSVIQPIALSLYLLCCLSSQNNQFIYHMKVYTAVQWQMLNTKKLHPNGCEDSKMILHLTVLPRTYFYSNV